MARSRRGPFETQYFCAATFKSSYVEINCALPRTERLIRLVRERRVREEGQRGTKRDGEGDERSWSARNSCDLMGFFDYYLMPIAIQPIYTPLTYTGGIRKNRGFSPRREISVCADFLAANRRTRERGSAVCETPAIVDLALTRIVNRTAGCFPRREKKGRGENKSYFYLSVYYITGGTRDGVSDSQQLVKYS